MDILSIIAAGLKLINFLVGWARDRQLMDQGAANHALEQMTKTVEIIDDAKALRSNLTDADRQRLRDKYTRRN